MKLLKNRFLLFLVIFIVLALSGYYFNKSKSEIGQGAKTFRSDVNDVSFDYPNCLGNAALDANPTTYGEHITFSNPGGCIEGLGFTGITLGLGGIDRGDIVAGIDHTVINRESFLNSQGKTFTLLTYELPYKSANKYMLEAFYPQEENGNELGAFIVMLRAGNARVVDGEISPLNDDELVQAKELFTSILKTVKFQFSISG